MNAHVSNKTPTGTYRGPGRVEANFFRERLIDMAAADLGIDPATIRLRNFVVAGGDAVQHRSAGHLRAARRIRLRDFSAVFEHAMREIGWSEKQSIQGRQVGGWFHGIGIASFVESGAGGLKEHARIRLRLDGPWTSMLVQPVPVKGTRPCSPRSVPMSCRYLSTGSGSSAPRPMNWKKVWEPGIADRP